MTTKQDFLREYNLEGYASNGRKTVVSKQPPPFAPLPEASSTAPQVSSSQVIENKRAELELKKLEIEIKKLETPNTSMDYFKEMLQLQQQHFNQLLTMQKDQSNLLLEIEKLKLGSDGEDNLGLLLDIVKPLLPQILAKHNTPQEDKKGVTMNREQYLAKIKSGEIDVKMAWEDFQLELPDMAKNMTFEQFTEQFKKIKDGEEKKDAKG